MKTLLYPLFFSLFLLPSHLTNTHEIQQTSTNRQPYSEIDQSSNSSTIKNQYAQQAGRANHPMNSKQADTSEEQSYNQGGREVGSERISSSTLRKTSKQIEYTDIHIRQLNLEEAPTRWFEQSQINKDRTGSIARLLQSYNRRSYSQSRSRSVRKPVSQSKIAQSLTPPTFTNDREPRQLQSTGASVLSSSTSYTRTAQEEWESRQNSSWRNWNIFSQISIRPKKSD